MRHKLEDRSAGEPFRPNIFNIHMLFLNFSHSLMKRYDAHAHYIHFSGTYKQLRCFKRYHSFFQFIIFHGGCMKVMSFLLIVFLITISSTSEAQPKKKQSPEVLKGYLVDKMCGSMMSKKSPEKAMAAAAKHTKACATEEGCAASGYGIMMNGKWTAFDEAGNKKAAEYLKQTKATDHIFIAVTGKTADGKLAVVSIQGAKEKVN